MPHEVALRIKSVNTQKASRLQPGTEQAFENRESPPPFFLGFIDLVTVMSSGDRSVFLPDPGTRHPGGWQSYSLGSGKQKLEPHKEEKSTYSSFSMEVRSDASIQFPCPQLGLCMAVAAPPQSPKAGPGGFYGDCCLSSLNHAAGE